MKKPFTFILIILLSLAVLTPVARATGMPVVDVVNAALNEIRNALMQSQFVEDMASAVDRLNQLKAQYLETLRFNSGVDEVLNLLTGDPATSLPNVIHGDVSRAFWDFSNVTPHFERLESASGAIEIRQSLEAMTGSIPNSEARAYIPFEEMQVVDGFQTAQAIREAGVQTRDAAQAISQQAQTASPKGAARLQADALSKMLVLSQQHQEAVAKLIELEATQVEQVSRDEKRLENERTKYMTDAKDYLSGLLGGVA